MPARGDAARELAYTGAALCGGIAERILLLHLLPTPSPCCTGGLRVAWAISPSGPFVSGWDPRRRHSWAGSSPHHPYLAEAVVVPFPGLAPSNGRRLHLLAKCCVATPREADQPPPRKKRSPCIPSLYPLTTGPLHPSRAGAGTGDLRDSANEEKSRSYGGERVG